MFTVNINEMQNGINNINRIYIIDELKNQTFIYLLFFILPEIVIKDFVEHQYKFVYLNKATCGIIGCSLIGSFDYRLSKRQKKKKRQQKNVKVSHWNVTSEPLKYLNWLDLIQKNIIFLIRMLCRIFQKNQRWTVQSSGPQKNIPHLHLIRATTRMALSPLRTQMRI